MSCRAVVLYRGQVSAMDYRAPWTCLRCGDVNAGNSVARGAVACGGCGVQRRIVALGDATPTPNPTPISSCRHLSLLPCSLIRIPLEACNVLPSSSYHESPFTSP